MSLKTDKWQLLSLQFGLLHLLIETKHGKWNNQMDESQSAVQSNEGPRGVEAGLKW